MLHQQLLNVEFLDGVNSAFISIGGWLVFLNCWQLFKDKLLSGVSIISLVFYTVWGMFNAYYYLTLGKFEPMWAEVFISVGNLCYLYMAVKYNR
jgi:hypothetical protein